MKRRIFYSNTLTHCYQRTADGGLLFYTHSDYLVHFTGYCITAKKYGIQVFGLCQMPDHIHDSVKAENQIRLEKFKRETNSSFSRQWNELCHLKGPVLESPFGSAPKVGDKKARTCLVYVGNNPVERKLSAKAEDYKWNYLAYAASGHPFSDKLIVREARWPMQKAVKEIKAMHAAGKSLNYSLLHRLFSTLDRRESLRLTDYIVRLYNVIDYNAAASYFGSYERMISAMHLTTGSEYDLNESFVGRSDSHYNRMTSILVKKYNLNDIHEALSASGDDKYEMFQTLMRETGAMPEQIGKFLHLQIKRG